MNLRDVPFEALQAELLRRHPANTAFRIMRNQELRAMPFGERLEALRRLRRGEVVELDGELDLGDIHCSLKVESRRTAGRSQQEG